MSIVVTIRFDGEGEAYSAHRLSVGDLGKPLSLLLTAVQRTASNIVRDATASDDVRRGRVADVAKALDLQIQSMDDGSIKLVLVLVSTLALNQTSFGFVDLPELAMTRVVQEIDREASGKPANVFVRNYLRSLPKGLTAHEYVATKDGAVLASANITTTQIATIPAEAPRLVLAAASIVGVTFEPRRRSVVVRVDGVKRTLAASDELIDRAIAMRDRDVRIVFLEDETDRLVRIDDLSIARTGTPDSRWALTMERFSRDLERLAR